MQGVMPMSIGLTDTAARSIGREVQSGLVPLLDVLSVPLDRFGQGIERLGQRLMDGFGRLTLLLGSLNEVRFGIPVQVTNLGYLQTLTFGLLSLSLTVFLILVLIFTRLGIMSSQLWQLHVDLDLLHDDIVALTIVTALFGALTVALLTAILGTLGRGLKVEGVVTVSITGLPEIDMLKLLELLGLAALGLLMIVGFVALLAEAFSLFNFKSLLAVFLVTLFLSQMTELLTLFGNAGWKMLEMAGGLALIVLFVWVLGKALDSFTDKAKNLLEPLTKFLELLDKMAGEMIALSIGGFAKLIVGLGVLAGFLFLVGLALDEMVPFATTGAMQPLANLLRVLGDLAHEAAKIDLSDLLTLLPSFAAMGALMIAIGTAFTKFTAENIQAIEPLKELLVTLESLAKTGAKFSRGDVGTLEDTFTAMGGLITNLASAFAKFTKENIDAIAPVEQLLGVLQKLAVVVSGFNDDAVGAVKTTFKAMGSLVGDLASAMNDFKKDTLAVFGPVEGLIAVLQSLAVALSGLSPAQVDTLKDALQTLIDFLVALCEVLDNFSEDALKAMPILTNLINALAAFATAIHNLTFLDLIYMGTMLAGIATFIGVVGEECMAVLPGLQALAGALSGINGIMEKIASIGGAVTGAIASVGDEAESLFDKLGGWKGILIGVAPITAAILLQEGGMVEHTGLAVVHEGERVLSRGETQAFEGAMMAPGLAASPLDQSINLGGVTINIHTDRLDANNADVLSDTIVARLQEKLASLHTEQLFRTGVRAMA